MIPVIIHRTPARSACLLLATFLALVAVRSNALAADWPTDERQLDKDQRFELQRHLLRMGYDVGDPDGRLGSKTREAVRAGAAVLDFAAQFRATEADN